MGWKGRTGCVHVQGQGSGGWGSAWPASRRPPAQLTTWQGLAGHTGLQCACMLYSTGDCTCHVPAADPHPDPLSLHPPARPRCRNDDYWPGRLPERPERPQPVVAAKRGSPATSPRGKPPASGGNGGTKAWKPGGKLPLSPSEEERVAAAARRRPGAGPPARADYDVQRGTSTYYPSGDRAIFRADAAAGGGGGGAGQEPPQQARNGRGGASGSRVAAAEGAPRAPAASSADGSPLDGLLQHVNYLLKDFDKLMARGAP